MPRRNHVVHVVTTRRRYKDRTYETHLLRRSYREEGKVKNETLGNISHLPPHLIDIIRRTLRGDTFVSARDNPAILRSRPHGHVAAVLGAMEKLGLPRLMSARRSPERDRCTALIVSRLLAAGSKLATARTLHSETATSTLGERLALDDVSAEDFYSAMDWLLQRQEIMEKALAQRHLHDGTLVLYDVSSSYLEGRHCELARLGYSRDGRKGTLQIVYGLLCNAEGCPVAVEVYAGNTADPRTLSDQIAKLRTRFALKRVVFVADRGLLTSARIDSELRPVQGLDWVSALRSQEVRQLVDHDGPLQLSLFDQRDLAEIRHPDFPGERLVACMNPLLRVERGRKREDLLQATERQLDKIVAAVSRPQRPLRGAHKIGERLGRVIQQYKMAKHFETEVTDTSFHYRRKTDSIEAEARLDGIYVIRTSVDSQTLDATETVHAYKRLATVERAFRCLKTIDLHVRPIYHRLGHRVRAHVFLCMLAYHVEWHMRRWLAPLLFADDDPHASPTQRPSPVQAPERSRSAQHKASTRRTTHREFPVHHFRGLLDHLATLTQNTVRMHGSPDTFELLTVPTPIQRKAFDLIGVQLSM